MGWYKELVRAYVVAVQGERKSRELDGSNLLRRVEPTRANGRSLDAVGVILMLAVSPGGRGNRFSFTAGSCDLYGMWKVIHQLENLQ